MSPQPRKGDTPGTGTPHGTPASGGPESARPASIADEQPAEGPSQDAAQQGREFDYGGQDAGADPVLPGDAKVGPADGYPDDAVIDLPHESGTPDPEALVYDDLGPGKKYVAGASEQTLTSELPGSAPEPKPKPDDAKEP